SGYILRSRNQGNSWHTYQSEFPKSIYSVKFRDELHGYAGGDFLHMWTTADGGQTWSFYWLGNQVPFNGEDRPAIRDFEFIDESNWYFCGGENLGEGVLYSSNNAGNSWEFKITGNEMRCMDVSSDGTLLSGGHGAIWHIQTSAMDATQSNFENDFITSSARMDDGTILFCSYDGKIYSCASDGNSLTEKMDGNRLFGKRINWNDIQFSDGIIVVCGNDGMFAESQDNGSSWKISQLQHEPHLFSVDFLQNQWWAGSENGKLYRIK
ncbi:MAG: YCF48-related protein, partial [Flavobacteriales bacterium]